MSLDAILREMEQGKGPVRDPELYFLSIFGDARSAKPWDGGWKDITSALNFTLLEGKAIAVGRRPSSALIRLKSYRAHGKGCARFAPEEDLARSLIKSPDDKQRPQAGRERERATDILSTNLRKAEPLKPAGLQTSKLGQKQQEILMTLLGEYASRHRPGYRRR